MPKERKYLGDPPPKPRINEEQMVALRKSIVETLGPVIQAIPEAVGKTVGTILERMVESQPKMITADQLAAAMAPEIAKIRLPAPQVTVEAPEGPNESILTKESLEAIQAGFQAEAREYVTKLADVMSKQDGAKDLKALAEQMKNNPDLYLNFRLTNGKKFIDALTESFVVGMGGADAAKNATLVAILNRLGQTLTVSGTIQADVVMGDLITISGQVTANPPVASVSIQGQKQIAVSGTAVQLAPGGALRNGLIIRANHVNRGAVVIGDVNVTSVYDGTGVGHILLPGESAPAAVDDVGRMFVVGAYPGDSVSWIGS